MKTIKINHSDFPLGAVLLDLEQFDLSNIAEAVIEEMVITDQLPRAQSGKVLSALLSKHRHQHQMQRGLRRQSSSGNLAAFFGVESKGTPLKPTETDASKPNDASPAQEAKENIPLEPIRPRTTSDVSSQTPFSKLDYLEKVCIHQQRSKKCSTIGCCLLMVCVEIGIVPESVEK